MDTRAPGSGGAFPRRDLACRLGGMPRAERTVTYPGSVPSMSNVLSRLVSTQSLSEGLSWMPGASVLHIARRWLQASTRWEGVHDYLNLELALLVMCQRRKTES
jgi:hypothetical protein